MERAFLKRKFPIENFQIFCKWKTPPDTKLIVQPRSPPECPIPSVVGVWIFSGTTQCKLGRWVSQLSLS